MFRNNCTAKVKVVLFATVFVLASCHTEEIEILEKEDPLLESVSSQPMEGHYIVVLKQESINARISPKGDYSQRTAAIKLAISPILQNAKITEEAVSHVYSSTVFGFCAPLNEANLEWLRKDPEVAYIEQDKIITLVPPSGRGGQDPVGNQEIPYGITRVGGEVNYTGKNVVWIIDTGIDLDHPDLNVDDSKGFNVFSTGPDAMSLDDENGHGTHVAGIVAAIDNDFGVVGVAAGATVIPVKVLDSKGLGTYSGIIAGVDYVAGNGKSCDVANMSLGGPASQSLDDAVVKASEKGIYFILAAGNDSDDANNYSPARANGANIYTISAMDNKDNWANFSNYGNPPVDFCAPGVSIKSTWKDGGYRMLSGTSMAAPHAAGVLLVTDGNPSHDGKVNNDPDGIPDPIIFHKVNK